MIVLITYHNFDNLIISFLLINLTLIRNYVKHLRSLMIISLLFRELATYIIHLNVYVSLLCVVLGKFVPILFFAGGNTIM